MSVYISGIVKESISDGPGIRTAIFFSGCNHNCDGCHNPETHDFKYGYEFTLEKQLKLIDDINHLPLISGLTLTGGDPLYSVRDVIDFLKLFKEKVNNKNINIWCYTGFTFHEIIIKNDPDIMELLNYIDVLVDGRYDKNLYDPNLYFKGSSNQKTIDVHKSLEKREIVLFHE